MLFSVITVTKNNPQGFERTRDSLKAQTCNDYEWIVIDGAQEWDDGIYDAMNKALNKAKGQYVIFMNAGDTFANDNTLSIIAAAPDADFIYGDALESRHLKTARHDMRLGMMTHHQAMIYRRSIIGDLRYDLKYRVAADYKFTLEFLARASTRHYMPIPLCDFAPGGLSQTKTRLGRQQQAMIRKELGIKAPFICTRQAAAQFLKDWAPGAYWIMRGRRSNETHQDTPQIQPAPIADNPAPHHACATTHHPSARMTGSTSGPRE